MSVELSLKNLQSITSLGLTDVDMSDAIIWYRDYSLQSILKGINLRQRDNDFLEKCDLLLDGLENNLRTIFAYSNDGRHFLASQPFDWGFPLLETQITRAFACFLNAGHDRELRLMRCRALCQALAKFSPNPADLLIGKMNGSADAYCASEYGDGKLRIDLFIWFFGDLPRTETLATVAIECKMGADLGEKQLSNYNRILRRKTGLQEANSGAQYPKPNRGTMKFLVVRTEDAIGKKHKKGPSDWITVPWAALLIEFQRELTKDQTFTQSNRLIHAEFNKFLSKVYEESGRKLK